MELDFDKMNGLVPAIIQDNETRKVLMLGFMNKEAYDKRWKPEKLHSLAVRRIVYGQKVKKAVTSFMLYL